MSKSTFEKAAELVKASEMLNEELGDWWQRLGDLNNMCRYCSSDEFYKAYAAEVDREYNRLKSEFRIVKRMHSPSIATYKVLMHVDDIEDIRESSDALADPERTSVDDLRKELDL